MCPTYWDEKENFNYNLKNKVYSQNYQDMCDNWYYLFI